MAKQESAYPRGPNQPSGEALAGISNAIVGLYSDHFGKRPAEAKTYAYDDVVVCVLRNGVTPLERTLSQNGQESTVHNVRSAFQNAVADRFTSIVERSTNRGVVAFMSQAHIDPDLTVEIFFLGEPRGERAIEAGRGGAG
jgi:uncharacterized protein YbcI